MKLYVAEKTQTHLNKKIMVLKLEDQNQYGVASLSSWPHLGDPELSDLQKDLVSDQKYSLVQKALYFAIKDLKQENIHTVQLPESHRLVQDEKYLGSEINSCSDLDDLLAISRDYSISLLFIKAAYN